MDLLTFQHLFSGSIRAIMDYDAMLAEGLKISFEVIERDGLGNLLTVWYVNKDGKLGRYDDPTSTPMRIKEVVENAQIWSPERVEEITHLQSQFNAADEPVVLMIPCQRVQDSYLILDGTHRLSAAYLSTSPVRILLVALDEAKSGKVNPDILRWQERLGAES